MISENDRRSAQADRRLVGVDLGIASDHTVRVLRGDGSEVCRRRACPTVESLTRLETAALVGAPVGTRLEVVIEPTGPAWLPVAVFFTSYYEMSARSFVTAGRTDLTGDPLQ